MVLVFLVHKAHGLCRPHQPGPAKAAAPELGLLFFLLGGLCELGHTEVKGRGEWSSSRKKKCNSGKILGEKEQKKGETDESIVSETEGCQTHKKTYNTTIVFVTGDIN